MEVVSVSLYLSGRDTQGKSEKDEQGEKPLKASNMRTKVKKGTCMCFHTTIKKKQHPLTAASHGGYNF